MSVSLKVKPIKEPAGAQHPDPRHSVLPTHEFSMLIIAPRGSGKTTLILNLISDFYRGYFHSIKVFSPTMAGDAKWETIRKMRGILAENRHHKELETKSAKGKGGASKGASSSESESEEEEDRAPGHQYSYKTAWHSLFASTKPPAVAVSGNADDMQLAARTSKKTAGGKKFTGRIPHGCFHTDYDEDSLQHIMDETMASIRRFKKAGMTKHKADRQLLIFDDLVGSNLFSAKKNNPFRRLNTTLRHYSTSAIMVSQGYKEIPKTVRINASVLILFDIANQAELQSIYEENNAGLTKEEWFRIYRLCTAEPFNFMMINYKLPKPERIWHNLDEQIPITPNQQDSRELLHAQALAAKSTESESDED